MIRGRLHRSEISRYHLMALRDGIDFFELSFVLQPDNISSVTVDCLIFLCLFGVSYFDVVATELTASSSCLLLICGWPAVTFGTKMVRKMLLTLPKTMCSGTYILTLSELTFNMYNGRFDSTSIIPLHKFRCSGRANRSFGCKYIRHWPMHTTKSLFITQGMIGLTLQLSTWWCWPMNSDYYDHYQRNLFSLITTRRLWPTCVMYLLNRLQLVSSLILRAFFRWDKYVWHTC